VALSTVPVAVSGCSRQDRQLAQHQKDFESLGATTAAIVQAWLAGDVSETYSQTVLDRTLRLVEEERTAVASRPQLLLDPRGAHLSQTADHLSRLIAMLMHDISVADEFSARRRMADIPITPPNHP
jgi:hypothetical protein